MTGEVIAMRSARMVAMIALVAAGCAGTALPSSAAARAISLDQVTSVKGFVVAKTPGAMTLRDGRALVQVVVTPQTRVEGRRTSFGAIALDDLVRVEGSVGPDRRIVALRLEVVLAAGPMVAVRRSPPQTDDTVTLATW
jgi:hypothetical protein